MDDDGRLCGAVMQRWGNPDGAAFGCYPFGVTVPMVAELSARRAVVVAIPVAVPVTMAAPFARLSRCFAARTAYNVGFDIYWAGWCLAIPLWLLARRTITRLLITGRRLSRGQAHCWRCLLPARLVHS